MTVLFISLGCDKNLVDSEVMLGLLTKNGYTMTDDETAADVIVVNTCCFIDDAKDESVGTILEMAEYRKSGSCKALIVTGCMAQRYKKDIMNEVGEVDAVLGTTSYDEIVNAINKVLEGERVLELHSINALPVTDAHRVLSTGGVYAHLKIAEGCDKRCTYCIIPKLRGRYRSVPMERLVREAGELAEQGVKELILVAQETTLYGVDLYGEKSLHVLLKKLCQIPGFRWIRILYCYPEDIYEELVQTIKEEEKICNYLDMPIQHANDEILQRMGRKTTKKQLTDTIHWLRREIPDIALRTTLITGFPGETQEQFEELMEFVKEMKFERLGVFTYSREEGTGAYRMKGQVAANVKSDRRDKIMRLQQGIAFERALGMRLKSVSGMVEGKVADEDIYLARTYADAPGVDGCLFISAKEELISGDFVKATVTGALEYDLIGEIEHECAQ